MQANPPRFPPFPTPPEGHAVDPGRTVYGPAVLGTMKVDDPDAIASLAALRAPAMPRPAPVPVVEAPAPVYPTLPMVAPLPWTVTAAAALAVPLPPVGLGLAIAALRGLRRGAPHPRGETVAVLALVVSVLTGLAVAIVALG